MKDNFTEYGRVRVYFGKEGEITSEWSPRNILGYEH